MLKLDFIKFINNLIIAYFLKNKEKEEEMIKKVAEGIKIYNRDLHEFSKQVRMYHELYGKDISKYTKSSYNLLNMENERLLGMERVLRLSVEESLEFRQKEGIYSFYIVDIISR